MIWILLMFPAPEKHRSALMMRQGTGIEKKLTANSIKTINQISIRCAFSDWASGESPGTHLVAIGEFDSEMRPGRSPAPWQPPHSVRSTVPRKLVTAAMIMIKAIHQSEANLFSVRSRGGPPPGGP